MLFNSLVFLVFLAVVLLVYPRLERRNQNRFLLLASYVFYGYWDWRFNFLLLTSTVVDYFVGSRLHASDSPRRRRRLLFLSVAVNLGILGFFKYFNFFIGSAASMLGGLGLEPNMPLLRIVLPVGISFYTFQTLSYTIDIYRRRMEPVHELGERRPDLSWPRSAGGWLRDLVKIVLTFHLVCLTWILFRADSFGAALGYLVGILRLDGITSVSGPVLFAGALLLLLDAVQTWSGKHTWLADRAPRPLRYAIAQLLLISVLAAAIFHVHTITPFIYFQF